MGWAVHPPFQQMEEGWGEHSSESKGWEGEPSFWLPSFPPLSSCGQSQLWCRAGHGDRDRDGLASRCSQVLGETPLPEPQSGEQVQTAC